MEHLDNYAETNNPIELRLISRELKEDLLKYFIYVFEKYPSENKYYQRALQIFDTINKPFMTEIDCSKNLRGLDWVGNSCYLDSSLFSLFAIPNKFIDDNILNANLTPRYSQIECSSGAESDDVVELGEVDWLNRIEIQDKLKHIVFNIRNNIETKCVDLRKSLRKCDNTCQYAGDNTQDAGEFLTALFRMFDLNLAKKKTVTYGSFSDVENPTDLEITNESIDTVSSIIQYVPYFNIMKTTSDTHYELRDLIKIKDDSGILAPGYEFGSKNYRRRLQCTTLVDTPYLIFRIDRFFMYNFYRTKIIPNELITLDSLKSFVLSAIVAFDRRHYTCYFRCGNDFYYYDDGGECLIEKVGSYEDMLVVCNKPNVITNGTLYFYSPYEYSVFLEPLVLNNLSSRFVEIFRSLDDSSKYYGEEVEEEEEEEEEEYYEEEEEEECEDE